MSVYYTDYITIKTRSHIYIRYTYYMLHSRLNHSNVIKFRVKIIPINHPLKCVHRDILLGGVSVVELYVWRVASLNVDNTPTTKQADVYKHPRGGGHSHICLVQVCAVVKTPQAPCPPPHFLGPKTTHTEKKDQKSDNHKIQAKTYPKTH